MSGINGTTKNPEGTGGKADHGAVEEIARALLNRRPVAQATALAEHKMAGKGAFHPGNSDRSGRQA